jgi:pimeloyl-ACP methyl ester carboxylesterase
MTEWANGYVHSNCLQIHYYRTGGKKPQVVINHGAGDDGLCWTHVAKELENDYDVILPDARGHGKSDTGNGDYSTKSRVADLAGLIQALKLDKPVVGGHSMGAEAAMHLAAEYPEMIHGVFLEDPPIILPGEKFGIGKQEMNAEDIGKMMARFMRVFKNLPRFLAAFLQRKMSPGYPDDEIEPWVESKKRVSNDFLNSMPTMELDVASPFELFKKIQVPVLLFIGDKEKMSIVSEGSARKAAEANERVQVVHLAGASHDIRRTRFDGYMPALKKFLKEIFSA